MNRRRFFAGVGVAGLGLAALGPCIVHAQVQVFDPKMLDAVTKGAGARRARVKLDLPVLARVPVRAVVARAVDAGVLGARLPDLLTRPVGKLLADLGLLGVTTVDD